MPGWKSDRLYQSVFREIRSLWDCARAQPRPDLVPDAFRVEEHARDDWGQLLDAESLRAVWIFDADGPRLAPLLAGEGHDRTEVRGPYWRFGLVRFQVADDRTQVEIGYDLGPGLCTDILYEVVDFGDHAELELRTLAEAEPSWGA